MKFLLVVMVLVAVFGWFALRPARATGPVSLKEGDPAPSFSLPDQSGRRVALADYLGKGWVVLYFYPKDDTPGCTKEACDFRDHLKPLERIDATVLGVSVDSVESHKAFAEKYRLAFPLLADPERTVTRAYGALRSFLGFPLARRMTFLIDPAGTIRKIFPSVTPAGHAREVEKALQTLKQK